MNLARQSKWLHSELTRGPLELRRRDVIRALRQQKVSELIVIGDGLMAATVAHAAAFNGLRTVLLAPGDYAASEFLVIERARVPWWARRRTMKRAGALAAVAPHLVRASNGKYELDICRLSIERTLAARQEGALCVNYAPTIHTLRNKDGTYDVRARVGEDPEHDLVTLTAGIIVDCRSPSGGKSIGAMAGRGGYLTLPAVPALQAVEVVESRLFTALRKLSEGKLAFVPLADRLLPGAGFFQEACRELGHHSAALERFGGRLLRMKEFSDWDRSCGPVLFGELRLAAREEQPLTAEDLLLRRLGVRDADASLVMAAEEALAHNQEHPR